MSVARRLSAIMRSYPEPETITDAWGNLTQKQREIADFVVRHFRQYDKLPSAQKLQERFKWKSPNAGQYYLEALVERKFLEEIYRGSKMIGRRLSPAVAKHVYSMGPYRHDKEKDGPPKVGQEPAQERHGEAS